ncbi:hypothetical protein EVG20_g9408 [Dentipellis fragilis]|uniref:Uncharacterized protein n=1 Tax=Dentipellis fragilis TaxID=205917 RepID=A0A4Y9Y0E5_9AGAM|nr:hypothetical protein EVG20_g9408 [Dentipellis fragilis]
MSPIQAPTQVNNNIFVLIAIVLAFLFLIILFFAIRDVIRTIRRRRTSTLPQQLLLPQMLAQQAPPTFLSTCSVLLAQSTLLATAPARVRLMPDELSGKRLLRHSWDTAYQGLKQSVTWTKASFSVFGVPSAAVLNNHRLSSDSIVAKLLALQGQRDFDLEAGIPENPPSDRAGLYQYAMRLTDAFEDVSDPVPFSPPMFKPAPSCGVPKIWMAQMKTATEPSALVSVSSEVPEMRKETPAAEMRPKASSGQPPALFIPFVPRTYAGLVPSYEKPSASPLHLVDLNASLPPTQYVRKHLQTRSVILGSARRSYSRSIRKALVNENFVTTTTTTTIVTNSRRYLSTSVTMPTAPFTEENDIAELGWPVPPV